MRDVEGRVNQLKAQLEFYNVPVTVNPVPPKSLLADFQSLLDLLGLVPGFGEIADGLNGSIYASNGDKINAGLSYGAMVPFAGWGVAATKFVRRSDRLPDDAIVCRGGTCSSDRFENGSGVSINQDGTMSDVSVNSASGSSVGELTEKIPNGQVGVTTVGEIRAVGGDVFPDPTHKNPYHCNMCGVTPQQAQDLFTPTIQNPHR